jgi:methionyl-tRNA formyltransferase
MTKLKTIFMGTPEFCLPALELLATHPTIDLTLVVSMPDRPSGRGQELKSPPVIDFCKEHKINFIQTENINKEEEFLKYQADIIVVLAFAQFFRRKNSESS